jgi:hypothetical protein
MSVGQRNQPREAAAQSDLRNAVTTATARFADNSGGFDGCDIARLTADYGFRKSDKVEFSNVTETASASSWSAATRHQDGGATYTFSTVTAQVEKK